MTFQATLSSARLCQMGGAADPLYSLVEDGCFLCRVEAEEPFLLCRFSGGVDKLGNARHGWSTMWYLSLDGIVDVILGGQGWALVVEDQGQAIDGAGLRLEQGNACHPLFD